MPKRESGEAEALISSEARLVGTSVTVQGEVMGDSHVAKRGDDRAGHPKDVVSRVLCPRPASRLSRMLAVRVLA